MKSSALFLSLLGLMLAVSPGAWAEQLEAAELVDGQAEVAAELRFKIEHYDVEGATLLSDAELSAALIPYVGEDKQFADVQMALHALEAAYAQQGYTAIQVQLPEQQLEQGTVRLRVIESRFADVTVKDNRYVSSANVLHALPALRSGNPPNSQQIARELNLANENPARQLNVVLKNNEQEGKVDANVIVTDSKPASWNMSLDNSGTPETGRSRLGVGYRYANMFDADHVANLQYVTSPQFPNRVEVVGGSYKIPLYESGNSLEFFAGYSNVNSVVGGLSNFAGGGNLLSMHYNIVLDAAAGFNSNVFVGLDRRDFKRIQLTTQTPTTLYNEVVVTPLSVGYAVQGKLDKRDLAANVSLAANIPTMGKGKNPDFLAYDRVNFTPATAAYKVVHYAASYAQSVGQGWQLRSALSGQWSPDFLVQGEQMRLGGAAAVRGFAEGSESGETGTRGNVEGYTPDLEMSDFKLRGLMFFDAGVIKPAQATAYSVNSAGVGMRANFTEQFSAHIDFAKILKAGKDPAQRTGDTRVHMGLSATF